TNISRRPNLIHQGRTPTTGRVLLRPQQHHAAAPVADFLSAVHTPRIAMRPDGRGAVAVGERIART
ncbi:hypothetical protein, partial [Roseomonas rosulenta]|uniref:hypothetical protein n=1 Tax=Roseomonas rosulenta TaxID=2748667 RepID=UPI001E45EC9D